MSSSSDNKNEIACEHLQRTEKTTNDPLISNMINKDIKDDKEDIDFIFDNIVGSGKWNDFGQWGLFAAIMMISYCGIFPIFMHVYAAFEPRHRCLVPICDTLNTSDDINVDWMSFTSPSIGSKGEQTCQTEMLKVDETFDPCRRYTLMEGHSSCQTDSFNQTNIQTCTEFVYETSVVIESLTTKFNLVCDFEYQQMLLGSVVMFGLMIGSVLGGPMSDKLGRKRAMIISVLVCVPTVMFAGYSNSFWTYAILKLINTISLPCIWFSCHILITEIFGKEYRQNAVVIKELMWPIGMIMEIGLFYLTRHWVHFHLGVGGLCLLTIPAFLIAPESPRWLSVNGKWEDAEKVFIRIALWNRRKLSQEQKQKISSILQKLDNKVDLKQERTLGIRDMMKKNNLKKTIIMTLNWIIVCVTTFTLAFNVTKLSGDVFMNSLLLCVLGDVPGKFITWLTLKYFSRRFSLFILQLLCGLSCITVAFLPKKYEMAVVSFYLLASCFGNSAFALVYLITGELYPTNLRTRALGTMSTIARIFGVSSAFMSKLSCVWKPLPMLVLGIPSILIGALAYFLPETKKKNLPLAIKDT